MLASGRSRLRTTTTKSLSDLSVRNGHLKKQQFFTVSLQTVCLLFLLFLQSSFHISPCPSLPFPLHLTHLISISVPSLSFTVFTLSHNFPLPLLLSFFTHAHIQIRFNFELYNWTSNQKGLTSRNRTWETKWTNCSHYIPFIRFYSEDQISHLPKTRFRPQETARGKSSGLKSYIFCFSS